MLPAMIAPANADHSVGATLATGAGRGFYAGADVGGKFAALDQVHRAPEHCEAGAAFIPKRPSNLGTSA
jgi:enoyl-CoA hydratase/carnithine racemase